MLGEMYILDVLFCVVSIFTMSWNGNNSGKFNLSDNAETNCPFRRHFLHTIGRNNSPFYFFKSG